LKNLTIGIRALLEQESCLQPVEVLEVMRISLAPIAGDLHQQLAVVEEFVRCG
jgi:hypothetical protein